MEQAARELLLLGEKQAALLVSVPGEVQSVDVAQAARELWLKDAMQAALLGPLPGEVRTVDEEQPARELSLLGEKQAGYELQPACWTRLAHG